jgi:endonuclease-3
MTEKTAAILRILNKKFPDAGIQLKYKDNFQLLSSVILSAQCTDARVNIVTPLLFSKYKNIKEFADADIKELENIIKSTGFFRQKAKRIKESARMILDEFKGKVPNKMTDLLRLPGVARKTANVVLQNAYGINEGIVVDTHVRRVSNRLGLTGSKDPVRIEQDLMHQFNSKDYRKVSDLLIFHGRYTCKAQRPLCHECGLYDYCTFKDKKKFSEPKK